MPRSKRGKPQAGLYVIICKPNGRFYLGSSWVLEARRKSHFYNLRRGSHWVKDLQRDFDLYGEQAFQWWVVMLDHERDIGLLEKEVWRLLRKIVGPESMYNQDQTPGRRSG